MRKNIIKIKNYFYILLPLSSLIIFQSCGNSISSIASIFQTVTPPSSNEPRNQSKTSTPTSTSSNPISLFTGSLVSSVNTSLTALFNNPVGLGRDYAGNIYVVDSNDNLVRKITPEGLVSTIAGSGSAGLVDGLGTTVKFNGPSSIAADSVGNLYVADTNNNVIRRITPDGVVSTFAVGFSNPQGVAVDSSDNVFVADTFNNAIMKITPTGVVSTYASNTGPIVTTFNNPYSVAVDTNGNVYVADSGNNSVVLISNGIASTLAVGFNAIFSFNLTLDNRGNVYVADESNNIIQKIDGSGNVSTYAGSGVVGAANATEGNATSATFAGPRGIVTDASGNLYVAEVSNHTIRKISTTGAVTTFAGKVGTIGSTDSTGPRSQVATFSSAFDLTMDNADNIYIVEDFHSTMRKVTTAGEVSTFVGKQSINSPMTDGVGSAATFSAPYGVTYDSGMLYMVDNGNNTIRSVTLSGLVTTIAGQSYNSSQVNGTGTSATFGFPVGIAADSLHNLYVTDGSLIRKITTPGYVVSTFASGFGNLQGIAVDSSDNLYVGDVASNVIRRIDTSGASSVYAGSGGFGSLDDPIATNAEFLLPYGVAVDPEGNVYVADKFNYAIRKIAPGALPTVGGAVTTLAGSGTSAIVDGVGLAASFTTTYNIKYFNNFLYTPGETVIRKINPRTAEVTTLIGTPNVYGSSNTLYPAALFLNQGAMIRGADGSIYVANTFKHQILKVTPDGKTSAVLAGSGGEGHADGVGTAATFRFPQGITLITINSIDTLYVTDTFNHTIRKIDVDPVTQLGNVTTFAGTAGVNSFQDSTSTNTAALFNYPQGITSDLSGNLYVADGANHKIRKITTPQAFVTTIGGHTPAGYMDGSLANAQFGYLKSITLDSDNNAYLIDVGNNIIRKITHFLGLGANVETLFALTLVHNSTSHNSNKFSANATIGNDNQGNVYVADYDNSLIQKIDINGVATIVAGTVGKAAFTTETSLPGTLLNPSSIYVDPAGAYLYVLENNSIVKITLPAN